AVVYFDLKSSGKYGDVITGVHTPVARQAQLVDARGAPLSRVEVSGASVTRFTAKGPHVVLTDLTRPLVLGDTIIVTLVLEKMGGLGVIATVELEAVAPPSPVGHPRRRRAASSGRPRRGSWPRPRRAGTCRRARSAPA